jgi:hypothetical protein
VQRARDAGLRGVIVKSGYSEAQRAFAEAGVAWASERYAYPDRPEAEGRRLADDVAAGARFAVVNAEVEWESLDAGPMQRLVAEFRRLQPSAELYACVDTRGRRSTLPYQRVLAGQVAGWIPMVYPRAFRQTVSDAFAAALDAASFDGMPVLPVIQTYDGIGAATVADQIAEVRRRGLGGYSAYTIAHATDAEWAEVVRDARPGADEEEDDMREIERLRALGTAASVFFEAASYALRGQRLPEALRGQLRWLVGA